MWRNLLHNPKRLLLIDSLGATLTLIGLVGILMPFDEWFGMPRRWLVVLAVLASGLGLYSGYCFLVVKGNYRPYLRAVSLANLLYCALTAGLVIAQYSQLTTLGIAYFAFELVVVCGLVVIEQRALREQ